MAGGSAPGTPPGAENGAAHGSLERRAAEFIHTKFADWADLTAVCFVAAVLVIAASRASLLVSGTVLAASFVAPGLCYLLVSRSLRRVKGIGYERVFVGAAVAAGAMWVFEALAFFGASDSWRLFGRSLTTLNISTPSYNSPFPLLWAAIMGALMFVGAKHMRVNRWFIVALCAGIAGYGLWIAVGFPNHLYPWRAPDTNEILPLIPRTLVHPNNPGHPGWGVVIFWGSVFASLVKILIGTLPAMLFVNRLRGAPPAGGPPDDLIVKARKALERALLHGKGLPDNGDEARGGEAATGGGSTE